MALHFCVYSGRYVFLTLLQQLGWKRVGALIGDGKKYSDYVATLQDHAESNKITFVATRKIISSSSLEVLHINSWTIATTKVLECLFSHST